MHSQLCTTNQEGETFLMRRSTMTQTQKTIEGLASKDMPPQLKVMTRARLAFCRVQGVTVGTEPIRAHVTFVVFFVSSGNGPGNSVLYL
jgi:hypothetical protein